MGLITGDRVNGAARWMTFFGIQFQPSELAKMAVIIVTAFILSKFQEEDNANPKAFKYIMWITGIVFILIAPENGSTAALLFGVVFLMMVIGGYLEAIGQVNGNSRSYGGFFCRHSDDYAHTQTEQSPHDAPCRNLAEPYKRLL